MPEKIITMDKVAITGTELLGPKMTALVCELISLSPLPEDELNSVVIKADGHPKDLFGVALADANSIVINLAKCWDNAIETHIDDPETSLGVMGIVWFNILTAVAHELNHLAVAWGDRDEYEEKRKSEEGRQELEKIAEESALAEVIMLAQKFDTEIPAPVDMGWIGAEWMKICTGTGKNDAWVRRNQKLLEDGLIWDEEDRKIKSFREYIRLCVAMKGKYADHALGKYSSEWEEQATTPVNMVLTRADGSTEVFESEPVDQPKVEVDPETEEAAEALVNAAMGIGSAEGGGYVGAGQEWTPEMEEQTANIAYTLTTPAAAGFAQADAAVGAQLEQETKKEAEIPTLTPPITPPQTFAEEAATPPETVPVPKTYQEECSLSPEMMATFMEKVYLRMYAHIFTKCGWQQNAQTGRFMFMGPANIAGQVDISDLITYYGAENFVMEYDTHDANGVNGHSEKCQGYIRGHLSRPGSNLNVPDGAIPEGLPMYTIYLNINGHRIKRSLVPQNPEKKDSSGAYKTTANDAAAGNVMAWVLRGDDPGKKFMFKIRNNVMEAL